MNQEYTRATHARPSADTPQHSAALLIDFDNVTMGIRSNMGQELRNFLDSDIIRGKVAVQRAYADWRRYPQYIVPLSEASIDLIFAPAYGSSKKNATDIRLAIDALELVFTRPEIGTFILLSGDSDFSSLVLKLKEYGKYVIGVGLQESTSDILVQNCDEYFSYNRLSGLTSADDIQTEKHDPWELASKAIVRMADRGDVMRSDRLKQVMLEMDPSFDEKTTGFAKFNRFLGEAAQRELLRIRKRENGQYEVSLPKGGPPASEAVASTTEGTASANEPSPSRGGRSRRGRRGGRSGRGGGGRSDAAAETTAAVSPTSPDEGSGSGAPHPGAEAGVPVASDDPLQVAYAALAEVVDQLYKGGAPVRDSMTKRKLLARDSSFDEGDLGFRKFSLFLRQAHEDGIIDMRQHDDGNYYLTPAAGGRSRSGDGGGGSASKGRGGSADRSRSRPAKQRGESADRASRESGPGRAAGDDEHSESERKEGSAFSAAAAAARRTFGRFRRGSGPGEQAPASPGSQPRMGPIDEPPARKPAHPTPERPTPSPAEPAAESPPEPPVATSPAAEPASKPPVDEPVSKPPVAEPVSAPPVAEPASEPPVEEPASTPPVAEPEREPPVSEKTTTTPPASEPESAPRPRGMGRYRAGSRGRAPTPRPGGDATRSRIGPIPKDEPASGGSRSAPEPRPEPREPELRPEPREPEPSSAVRTDSNGGAPESPAGGPVEHMVRNYAGVGKRTAEVLFERFGDGVFDIIDDEPRRLTEVLSEARAKVVVEARRAEREA